jgi:hypothetical protein
MNPFTRLESEVSNARIAGEPGTRDASIEKFRMPSRLACHTDIAFAGAVASKPIARKHQQSPRQFQCIRRRRDRQYARLRQQALREAVQIGCGTRNMLGAEITVRLGRSANWLPDRLLDGVTDWQPGP